MNSIPVYVPFVFGTLTIMFALWWIMIIRQVKYEGYSAFTAITELLVVIAMVVSFVESLITSMLLVAGG